MAVVLEARNRVPRRSARVLPWIRRHAEYLILLVFLGAGLVNLNWGLPESWPSDEISWVVDNMLTHHTTNTGWFYYPNLMMNTSYLATVLLGLPILSHLGWDQTYIVGYTSRLVSVAFYLLTVWFVAKAIGILFDSKRVPFAIFFIGAIGTLNHHAHLATVSSSLFFGIALTIYFFARTCKTRREIDLYCCVAAASLATGAKYNGAFLFASIPILWRWVFPRFSTRTLLRPLVISAVIAPVVFLITTPYAVLDIHDFVHDINDWLAVEGPAFGHTDLSAFVEYFRRSYIGFFTVGVLGIMLLVLLPTMAVFLRTWIRSRHVQPLPAENAPIFLFVLVLVVAYLTYQVVCFRVGNYQPRHYLPGAEVLAAMFLVAWYYWRLKLKDGWTRPRVAMAAAATVIVLSASANTYIHVWVFSASARNQTLAILQEDLRQDPQARIGALAMPGRSPFQRGVIDDHVDFFYVDTADYDVETWDEYLAIIGNHFKNLNDKYMVLEDNIFRWPVFRPKRFASDYGKRLDYPNPGMPAWDAMLEGIGYKLEVAPKTGMYHNLKLGQTDLRGTRVMFRAVEWLIGSEWAFTAEGVGDKVYIFERMSANATPQ